MRDWSLSFGDPLYLVLAADARFCKPDYVNDHIWEAEIGAPDSDRAAIGLSTTYGLRARAMRIFLRFGENEKTVSAPGAFHSKPLLRRYYPNFLFLEFSPLENLNAVVEFWIPESHAAAGRVTLTNKTNAVRAIRLEVCAALSPLDGQPMTLTQRQSVNILAGQTGGIAPVIFSTGGPKHGEGTPASLLVELELGPGGTRQITFAEAALETIEASFELARRVAARPWEAERARIELLDLSQNLDIRTGDPDWDAALMFSQQAARGLFFQGNGGLPYPTFVSARNVDNGFSPKGDGADYPPAWSGQLPLDAYYLSSVLCAAPEVAKQLVLNFLSTQSEDGEADNKPGLAGQRSRLLAAPLLATLAWRYDQLARDDSFLAEAYPKLVKFFWSWFSPEHDRNRDGVPEWDHLLQTGFEDNPVFDVWHDWSQGLNVSFVHHPALEAMLYREAESIVAMARRLGKPEEETALIQAQAARLKESMLAGWNAGKSFFSYRDYQTGLVSAGKVVASKKGEGAMRPKFESETPVRLLVEIQTKNPAARLPEAEVSEYFSKKKGEIEIIEGRNFQWRAGGLVAATQKVYIRVGRVSVRGLEEKDRVIVKTADTRGEDLTLALPLWAGVLDSQKASALIARNLMTADRFDRAYGLPSLTESPNPEADLVAMSARFPWNQLIGEGLLRYGFRSEATRLAVRMVSAVIQNLKQSRSFYQRYHAEKGAGAGERNSLQGLAPVGLFMQALGVTIFSASKVRLEGKNLFPWTVTIKYKGLTVVRGAEQTVVMFPNGESAVVKDERPCVVEM